MQNKPIVIKIRSIWNGQVGIRDKYVKDAVEYNYDLYIVYGDRRMTLENNKIAKSIKGRSNNKFKDKFSNEWHYLIYFDWKPNEIKQIELF